MPLRGEIVHLFAFDVGQEVYTAAAGPRFTRPGKPLDPRRRKTVPPDAVLNRPLTAELPAERREAGGVDTSLEARVYDAGVITVTARAPFAAKTLAELRFSPASNSGVFADVARRACEQVRSELGDAIRGSTEIQGPEAYTVFVVTDLGGEQDVGLWLERYRTEVVGLLTGLNGAAVGESQMADTFRLRCSLERTDAVVIDWDAALAIDTAGGADEVLYVLEVANLQLLEWKVLDAVLDRYLDRAYDHFARQPGVFSFGWGAVLRDLRRLRADAARLTDEVSNISKFIGDWYLARVYQSSRERFHLDGWRASLDHRLSQLDRIYGAMQSDANDRRMLWLEVLIVLLIAVELLLNLFGR